MSWRPSRADWIKDKLRLIAWAAFFVNVLIFAPFSVWFCGNVVIQLKDLCKRTIFAAPWLIDGCGSLHST